MCLHLQDRPFLYPECVGCIIEDQILVLINGRTSYIHPSMALQPLPGLGLPHKMPPFIPICSFTLPSSFPQQLLSISLNHIYNVWTFNSQVIVYLLVLSEASLRVFYWGGVITCMPNPPTWRTRVSLFVWAITFDLSNLGDPASATLPPA